jgi:hypothetical protein
MNPSDLRSTSSDAIRSDITDTRKRMDHKIDALTDRLHGRHLADELLGFFRADGRAGRIKNEIIDSAGSAIHSAVDTIKSHPVPALCIGAGLVWLIYEAKHKNGGDHNGNRALARGAQEARDNAAHLKESVAGQAGEFKERAREAVENFREHASEGASRLGESAARVGERVSEVAQNAAQRAGRQVAHVSREHPLETGLSCFAVGLIGALLVPTPERLREAVEPTGERVRNAGRDLVQRGKRVAQAAVSAAEDAAEKEGLTPGSSAGAQPSSGGENQEESGEWSPTGPPPPVSGPSRL